MATSEQAATETPRAPITHAGAKTVALIVMTLLLLGGFVLYVKYARGVFEETQGLVLLAENSEGVTTGMDMTFSGFVIGRVRRIELGDDGKAHIHLDIPIKDARWKRMRGPGCEALRVSLRANLPSPAAKPAVPAAPRRSCASN